MMIWFHSICPKDLVYVLTIAGKRDATTMRLAGVDRWVGGMIRCLMYGQDCRTRISAACLSRLAQSRVDNSDRTRLIDCLLNSSAWGLKDLGCGLTACGGCVTWQ